MHGDERLDIRHNLLTLAETAPGFLCVGSWLYFIKNPDTKAKTNISAFGWGPTFIPLTSIQQLIHGTHWVLPADALCVAPLYISQVFLVLFYHNVQSTFSILRYNCFPEFIRSLVQLFFWPPDGLLTMQASWINWTNLISLYESFLLLNMFRMFLHSSSGADESMWVYCSVSVCTGVLVRFGWSRVVSECRLEHCSNTPKQNNTPT